MITSMSALIAIAVSTILRWVVLTHLFESVLRILNQFTNAPILHSAVRDFAMVVLRHRELRNHMLEIFLLFIFTEAIQRQHG
jgi:hypothetical protein